MRHEMKYLRSLIGVVGALVSANVARAASTISADDLKIDFAVPQVPAFTLLDLSPAQVSRPGSVRDLVLALGNGVTANGGLQSGLAIEVAPAKLSLWDADADTALKESVLWSGLRLSVATNTVHDDKQTKSSLAAGVRWSISTADTNLGDLQTCLALATPSPPPPGPMPPSDTVSPPEGSRAELADCRDLYQRANLANWSFEIATALSFSAANDFQFDALSADTLSIWATGTIGWNRAEHEFRELIRNLEEHPQDSDSILHNKGTGLKAQLAKTALSVEPLLFVRLDLHHASSGYDGTRDLRIAAQLPLLWAKAGVYFEAGVNLGDLTNLIGKGTSVAVPLGVGGEVRVGSGTWLGLFFGGDASSGQLLALSNLKWSIGPKREVTLH
jgi:hypothetical protein